MTLDPAWIRIRIEQTLWIRILIQSIRIHITASLSSLSSCIRNMQFFKQLPSVLKTRHHGSSALRDLS